MPQSAAAWLGRFPAPPARTAISKIEGEVAPWTKKAAFSRPGRDPGPAHVRAVRATIAASPRTLRWRSPLAGGRARRSSPPPLPPTRPTHQQAFPTWIPAWPMWMEMTSRILAVKKGPGVGGRVKGEALGVSGGEPE